MVVVAMVDPDHTKHDDNPEKKIHATDAIPTADLGLPFFFRLSLYVRLYCTVGFFGFADVVCTRLMSEGLILSLAHEKVLLLPFCFCFFIFLRLLFS